MFADDVIGKSGQPVPSQRRRDDQVAGIEYESPGHMGIHTLSPSLEFPGHQPAMCRQAPADAIVFGEILRCARSRMARKIVCAVDND